MKQQRRYAAPYVLIASLFSLAYLVPSTSAQIPGLTETTKTGFGGRHSIAGTVLLPSGDQANSRIVIRLVGAGRSVSTTTDEVGRFLITELHEGGYTIHVEPSQRFERQTENITVDANPLGGGQTYTIQIRLREKRSTETKAAVVDAEMTEIPKRAIEFYEKAGERVAAEDTRGAVDLLLKAVGEHPSFFLAHTELGVQYQKLNDLEKADQHLQSALKIKPEAFDALANRGIVLVRLRKYADAEPLLRKAIGLKADSAIVDFYLGRSLLGQKRPDDAEPVFRTAYEKGGKDMIEARRALATIYLERGENDKALAEIDAYLAANPTAYDAKQLQETAAKIREWLKANAKP